MIQNFGILEMKMLNNLFKMKPKKPDTEFIVKPHPSSIRPLSTLDF